MLGLYLLGPNDAPENGIYTGECSEMMRALPDKCIDLAVTSPPYDNLRTYRGYTFDFEAIAAQLWRVTKVGGVVVWVVGDQTIDGSETGTSFRQALGFMELGFNLYDTMIYLKNGPTYPARDKYYQIFEYMFVFSRGKPKTFNPIVDRVNRWAGQKWSKKRTRRSKDGGMKDSPWDPEQGGKLGVRFNAWKYNVGHNYSSTDDLAYQHPAIFPEALARDHILSWSNPGDVVLDPMVGSGTTCKMARQLGRQWLGFDISEEYTGLARRRVANAQPPLFVSYTNKETQ